ncbi:sensor histidine kinase [candidate division KSB1 bacterium]|nr:sensor histidine kinase [candidate division KSB1 bacterium]
MTNKIPAIVTLLLILFIPVFAGPQKSRVDINSWQMRWGDSPVDSAGVPIWTYRELSDSNWINTETPYCLSGKNKNNFLWVRIKSPDIKWVNPTLYLTGIMYAAEVFVDTNKVYSAGLFKPDKSSRFNSALWHMCPLGSNSAGKTVFLRIYSDNPADVGIPVLGDNKVFIGSQWSIIKYIISNSIDRFVLGCLFILIGILTLDLCFHRWSQKPFMYLSFSLFSFSAGLAYFASGEFTQLIIPNPAIRLIFTYIGLAFYPVGLFSFYEQIINPARKKIIRGTWIGLLFYGIIILCFEATGIIQVKIIFYIIWVLLIFAGYLIALAHGIKYPTLGNIETQIFNTGFIIMSLFVVHDLLFNFGLIPYWRWVSQWGVLIFILSLLHLIEMNNTRDNKKLARYSKKLEEYGKTLETKVSKRTSDLFEKNKKLEETMQELQNTQQQLILKEKMASLGHLVAGVAHELNNPISAMNSASNIQERCLNIIKDILEKSNSIAELRDNEQFNKTLALLEQNSGIISNGSQRVSFIVKSLKNFARLDEAVFQKADIHEGLDSTIELLHHELKNRVTVIKEYGKIPKINCYPNELNQVFVNLVANAAQAIEGQGEIRIVTSADDKYVVIKVIDNGPGIKPEHINRVFDPGFTTKGVGVGTGLGLSISYTIIKKHNGEVTVKSQVGKGTTFEIKLPVNN